MTTLPADVSATQLATILGIGRRKVSELDREGVLPKNDAGRFPLAAAIAAYIAHRLAEAKRDPNDTFKDKYASERARKLRIENDLRDRRLVLRDEADSALSWFIGQTTVDLQSVPARISDTIAERRLIETAIDDARAAAADVMTSHALAQGAESDRAMQNSFITLGE